MTSTIVSLALVLAAGASGWPGGNCTNPNHRHPIQGGGRILAAGPGLRLGVPQRQPRRLRLVRPSARLSRSAPNRTPDYYFPRYFAVPADADVHAELLQPVHHSRPALPGLCRLRWRPPGGRSADRVGADTGSPVPGYDRVGPANFAARVQRPSRGPAREHRRQRSDPLSAGRIVESNRSRRFTLAAVVLVHRGEPFGEKG